MREQMFMSLEPCVSFLLPLNYILYIVVVSAVTSLFLIVCNSYKKRLWSLFSKAKPIIPDTTKAQCIMFNPLTYLMLALLNCNYKENSRLCFPRIALL